MVPPLRPPGLSHRGDVEVHPAALAIEEDGVVLAGIEAGGPTAGPVAPDDLVHEVVLPEDIVQHQPKLGVHAPVDMQIQTPGGGEERMTAGEDGAHPLEVFRLRHIVPEEGYPALLVLVAPALEGIPRAEGRVQVDELHLPFVFVDQLRQELFRTNQKKGTGTAYIVLLRFAIDPHSPFLRSLLLSIIIQDVGPDSKGYPHILLIVVTFFARFRKYIAMGRLRCYYISYLFYGGFL